MRIIKEDQSVMILKDRAVAIYGVGVMFLLFGLIVIIKPDISNQPPFWVGLIGILLGGLVISLAKIVTVKIDKLSGKISLLRKGLVGQSSKEYNLAQVKEVEMTVGYRSSGKGSGYSYHLAFILNSGETIELNPGSSSTFRVMGKEIVPEKTTGARMAAFMGVPFHQRRPPTINETLSAVTSGIQNAAQKEIEKQK